MEKKVKEEGRMNMPPGFRFHPTDEELISHYLCKKVINFNFSCRAIGQVDMNKSDPWDLPRKAKMGEKEWYFFCLRDRKYPTGLRINRATESGYWKATGKDKEIFRDKYLIGKKKTLVFYTGRAPKGEKSDWVIHEYRLDGKFSVLNPSETSQNEWVICRVFQKSSSNGKKVSFSGLEKLDSSGSALSPLEDSPSLLAETEPSSISSLVPCFSNRNCERNQQNLAGFPFNPKASDCFSRNSFSDDESILLENLQFPESHSIQGQSIVTEETEKSGCNGILRRVEGEMKFAQETNRNQIFKTEEEMLNLSQETEEMGDANKMICWAIADHEMMSKPFDYRVGPPSSAPHVGPDSFWNIVEKRVKAKGNIL